MRKIETLSLLVLAAAVGCGGGSSSKGLTPKAAASAVGTGTTGSSTGSSTGTSTPAPVRLVSHAFETIAQGGDSALASREDHLVTAPIPFDALWNRHTNFASPSPRFNFHDYAIVATFAGARGTPGHTTDVVAVRHDDASGDVHAVVRDFSPGTWKRTIAQRCSPYHMASFDRPASLSGRIVVQRQRRLDFEVLHAGSDSLIGATNPAYAGDVLAFRAQADFSQFWFSHTTDPMPVLDFANEMAVAVLAGYIPSFGNSVETRRVLFDEASNQVRVDFTVHPYRGGARPPQATETPFQVLRVSTAPGTVGREVRSPLPPTEVATGASALHQGGIEVQVIRDAATLDGVLQGQIGGAHPAYAIDWTREQVVVALLGAKPSTAWSIEVARAEMLEDGEIEVFVHWSAPMGRPMATPTSPWQIARMPRTYGPSTARVVDVTPRP